MTTESTPTTAGCEPLAIDFDGYARRINARLAARAAEADHAQAHRDVVHALGHLREALPGMHDRDVAKVLLATSALGADVLRHKRAEWTGRALINFIAACGEHLWHWQPPLQPPASAVQAACERLTAFADAWATYGHPTTRDLEVAVQPHGGTLYALTLTDLRTVLAAVNDEPQQPPKTALTFDAFESLFTARTGDQVTLEFEDGTRVTASLVHRGVRNPIPVGPPPYSLIDITLAVPNAPATAAALDKQGPEPGPACCCKEGQMCAACGTGHHHDCPDVDEPDGRDGEDEPDDATEEA